MISNVKIIPTIYLITGKAQSGKDTFANYLKEVYEKNNKRVTITQMSKYLKYYAKEIINWDLREETKPRDFLQELGTNIREKYNKNDLLINRMIEDIDVFSYFFEVIIISDVRLKKEIYALKNVYNNIKVINIKRPNFDNNFTLEQKNHITEIDLDDFDEFDKIVINNNIKELKKSAEKIYTEMEKGV